MTQRSTARKWPSALPQNVMLKTASNAAAASINLRHREKECFGPRHKEIARQNGDTELTRGAAGTVYCSIIRNTRPPKEEVQGASVC